MTTIDLVSIVYTDSTSHFLPSEEFDVDTDDEIIRSFMDVAWNTMEDDEPGESIICRVEFHSPHGVYSVMFHGTHCDCGPNSDAG